VKKRIGVLVFIFVCSSLLARGQAPTAIVNGQVRDTSGAAIPNASVEVINDATNVRYTTETNEEGIYSVPNLPPGTYHIQVSKSGFKIVIHPDITLNVQDAKAIGFTLPVGPVSVTVTVEGGASLIDTESAAVSTVVDQTYVRNMPLNGRSFQDLILLTPGVVTNSPQPGDRGEFSVNGQRTESNYYVVDGVSANVGVYPSTSDVSNSGSLPSATILGTTQALVSVDALQEFRVQSSTYSAEHGRNPGGEFSFVTRSGTNQWHGTVFEYLRNDIFDANNWFNDFLNKTKPPLRQNDFGGTLGGPVRVPGVYNGKDKTFFFFSYEGLRLVQPQAASVSYVPDAGLRQSAPAALQPVLNAFPLPTPGAPSLGNGLAEFIGTWSNPGQIDSTSIRLDHVISDKLKVFFRFADTPSNSVTRNGGNIADPSVQNSLAYTIRSYTAGVDSLLSNHVSDDFRINYTSNEATFSSVPVSVEGAQAVNLWQLQGFSSGGSPLAIVTVYVYFPPFGGFIQQAGYQGHQRQWNIVDTLATSLGRHQVKYGIDYRRLAPIQVQPSPAPTYFFLNANSVQTNSVNLGNARSFAPAHPVYLNFSAFAQDEWRVRPRLAFSMGLRWEVNPAPGAPSGDLPYTVEGSSLSTLTLAPQGTPLWSTTWYNFAPRLGAAYVLRNATGWETVVRGGGGVFFDTGQQLGSQGYQGPGFSALKNFGSPYGVPASFPLLPAQVSPVIVNPPVAPYTTSSVYAFPAHLQLPYTLQWNLSIEQGFGKSQALTLSYVGANGRRLLEQVQVDASSFNSNFGTIFFTKNGLTSDYSALQVKFQRRLAHGLQALASYTWSHAIDYGSQNQQIPSTRGNSNYDVRHNFSGAVSYDLPNAFRNSPFARVLLNNWGFDALLTARTGFPVTLNGKSNFDPATGQLFFGGLNLVPGAPFYIYGSQYPGGRSINPAAFTLPTAGLQGNAPRNFVRGLDAWQIDAAVRREFPLRERLQLQFRAEAFNVFNHPNFGTVNATYCSGGPGCTFGQVTATLASSFPNGLGSLYRTGGPRSMQFALKVLF
jgi:Carboxypeptidase regulatory-like domain